MFLKKLLAAIDYWAIKFTLLAFKSTATYTYFQTQILPAYSIFQLSKTFLHMFQTHSAWAAYLQAPSNKLEFFTKPILYKTIWFNLTFSFSNTYWNINYKAISIRIQWGNLWPRLFNWLQSTPHIWRDIINMKEAISI